ncbi:GntR family transcriptional regulator [Oscillibacter sp. MSJ-2]|uniref:GntR family transcriptional regulator n=1 Tax=Dysosmobacter acutus TaxID=2841504 RepID=A0ABS6FB09_9FIRM|nr:TrkA C-terminal domain-containing protein [Dysosmobacter acutus]MBU5626846.1 GntR family transcriptional regulator [Dysosmobacter acutus]
MAEKVVPAQYLQIAYDLASRIASGEFQEGSKIYGRSVMASEYSVSPETIRRALKQLADMRVVDVRPQSGVNVLSADNARRYLEQYDEHSDTFALYAQLKDLIGEYTELNHRLIDVSAALLSNGSTYSAAANRPFPNYEIRIPRDSALIGKSIGSIRFWQATGGTIVAIRRGQHVILSPGPFAELYAGDVILMVGSEEAVSAAEEFVNRKIVKESVI